MLIRQRLTLVLFVTLLAGCSQIVHSPVSENNADAAAKGIRYFNSSPYLLVYANGKGGITTQLLYIADPFKKMSAQPKGSLAKLSTTLEFEKGVLKKSKDDLDGTGFPKAVVEAIKTVAPALLAAALNAPPDEKGVPAPQLYKIVVIEGKVNLVGSHNSTLINITTQP